MPSAAAELGQDRRADRVGLVGAARLPHRGDVIDVDVEPHVAHSGVGVSLKCTSTGTGVALSGACGRSPALGHPCSVIRTPFRARSRPISAGDTFATTVTLSPSWLRDSTSPSS